MIDIKDRLVEHPNRFKLIAVPGMEGVYDLIPHPGEVTEEGTAVNKALFNDLQSDIPIGSFLAFAGNVNSDMLDAAFGKGNEDRMIGLGRQLAMYAWFKGDRKTEFPFSNLITCQSLNEIQNNVVAKNELVLNHNVATLVALSPYAREVLSFPDLEIFNNGVDLPSHVLTNSYNYTKGMPAMTTSKTEVIRFYSSTTTGGSSSGSEKTACFWETPVDSKFYPWQTKKLKITFETATFNGTGFFWVYLADDYGEKRVNETSNTDKTLSNTIWQHSKLQPTPGILEIDLPADLPAKGLIGFGCTNYWRANGQSGWQPGTVNCTISKVELCNA